MYFAARSCAHKYVLEYSRIRRGICENCFCSCEVRCSRAEWIFSPVASIWQTSVFDIPGAHLQGSKLVIDKTIAQSRSLFLQLWPALFQGWVCFTHLLLRSSKLGCGLFEAHAWARLLVFTETFVQTVFCCCNLRYCRAECVSLIGFNVQSDIFAVMIAWS